jgi:5-methyltetrahydrofolate--homocysteine methyltransferase
MIQMLGLAEEDYRGARFADHNIDLKGNHEILALTKPEIPESVHRDFAAAGADILSTNTFSGNGISQGEYNTAEYVYEINRAAARIARKVADDFSAMYPEKPRFVAGSLGPTNKTCSISPDVNNPGYRAINFDGMKEVYSEQIRGLKREGWICPSGSPEP